MPTIAPYGSESVTVPSGSKISVHSRSSVAIYQKIVVYNRPEERRLFYRTAADEYYLSDAFDSNTILRLDAKDSVVEYEVGTNPSVGDFTAGKRVMITCAGDFPDPSGSPLMHTLEAETNYVIAGTGISTAYGFRLPDNANVSFTGNAVQTLAPQITYTGTGNMFEQNGGFLNISRLTVSCALGKLFALDATDSLLPANGVHIVGFISLITGDAGSLTNYSIVMQDVSLGILSIGSGLTVENDVSPKIFSMRQVNLSGLQDGVTALDLNDSVWTTFEMRDIVFIGAAGATVTAISGAADSANIASGTVAAIDGCEFQAGAGGSMTELDGLSVDDIRYIYSNNSGLADTLAHALLTVSGNSTETVISVQGTHYAAMTDNATLTSASMFTGGDSENTKVTYAGERTVVCHVAISASLIAVSGIPAATINLHKNGDHVAGIPVNAIGALPVNGSIPGWIISFATGDYVEIYISNEADTTNLIMQGASLAIHEA